MGRARDGPRTRQEQLTIIAWWLAARHQFGVIAVRDLQETLKKKGVTWPWNAGFTAAGLVGQPQYAQWDWQMTGKFVLCSLVGMGYCYCDSGPRAGTAQGVRHRGVRGSGDWMAGARSPLRPHTRD
jgi:hypothetical protein